MGGSTPKEVSYMDSVTDLTEFISVSEFHCLLNRFCYKAYIVSLSHCVVAMWVEPSVVDPRLQAPNSSLAKCDAPSKW